MESVKPDRPANRARPSSHSARNDKLTDTSNGQRTIADAGARNDKLTDAGIG